MPRWRIIIAIGIAICFVVSLIANVVLYRQATASYAEGLQVRLDPYGLKQSWPRDPATSRSPEPPRVVFFGDSRAESWPAPEGVHGTFFNRGIGGQTTAQILGRFDAHVVPVNPHVLILEAGINDLKAIPLFPARRDAIVADCKANLRQIVRRANEAGAIVVVVTIFPTGSVPLNRRPYWSADVDRAVEEVNADLRSLASDQVVVFDAYSMLQVGGKMPSEFALDMVHLNANGYARLNVDLKQLLESIAPRFIKE